MQPSSRLEHEGDRDPSRSRGRSAFRRSASIRVSSRSRSTCSSRGAANREKAPMSLRGGETTGIDITSSGFTRWWLPEVPVTRHESSSRNSSVRSRP